MWFRISYETQGSNGERSVMDGDRRMGGMRGMEWYHAWVIWERTFNDDDEMSRARACAARLVVHVIVIVVRNSNEQRRWAIVERVLRKVRRVEEMKRADRWHRVLSDQLLSPHEMKGVDAMHGGVLGGKSLHDAKPWRMHRERWVGGW